MWTVVSTRGRAVAFGLAVTAVLAAVSTPAAAAADRPRPFFGIAVPQQDVAAVPAITSAAGVAPSVFAIFVKYRSVFTLNTLQAIGAHRLTPFVTVEPWSWADVPNGADQPENSLRSIYTGAHDVDLRAIARVIKSYHALVYLRFAHEMNGWWLPWDESVNGNAPGDYVKAWRHVHDLFVQVGATNAKWVWSPAPVQPHANATPLDRLYPGDAYVDYAGMTCYGSAGTASGTCGPTLSEIATITSRPIILSEVGAQEPDKVDWILSLAELVNSHPSIRGFVWFNTTPSTTGATGDYSFTDNAIDTAAFRRLLAETDIGPPVYWV